MADVSCRIVAFIAIDSIILCFLSFVMPHVDLFSVPFYIELTPRRGPQPLRTLVSNGQVVEESYAQTKEDLALVI